MAPELINPQQFGFEKSRPTKSSDCYALGMVIYETISGNLPFCEHKGPTVFVKILAGERPPWGEGFAEGLWKMLELCWTPQPNSRPNIEDVLQCLKMASNLWQPHSPGVDVSGSRSILVTPSLLTQSTSSLLSANRLTVWNQLLVISPYQHGSQTAQWPPSWGLISQILYTPSRTRGAFVAADPVSFSVNGVPGISISQAVAGEHAELDGKDEEISTFEKSKTICRIQVRTMTPRTSIPPTPSTVRWAPSVHIHGKKSSQPACVLLKRLLGKHPP
jgi:hypothetical protein